MSEVVAIFTCACIICRKLLTQSNQAPVLLPVYEMDGSVLPVGDTGKCLGYWWKGDLSASRSIEKNIQKPRHVFFLYIAPLEFPR